MTRLGRILRRRLRAIGPALDHLIAPEISNDALHRAIADIAARQEVRHILEIGSSSGEGSTEAFVTGMQRNPGAPVLHCVELSCVRFAALVRRHVANPSVRCYRLSSVPLEAFPLPREVERFYRETPSPLNRASLETVLGWLRQDLDYLAAHGPSAYGIRQIRESNGIEAFDAVLIDGSEFTGRAELDEIYGARYLLLDDTRTFKNHHNYHRLSGDPGYRLIAESPDLRNGYAVFERVA